MSYSNLDVAHRWATGIGTHCSSGNMFFEGDCIYSYGYHFKIAQKWNGAVLFSEEEYSNTTSKHKGDVLSACSHMPIIRCAVLTHLTPGTKVFYDSNLNDWKRKIECIVVFKLEKARKPEKYYAWISDIVERVEAFCKFFKIKVPKFFLDYKISADGRNELVEKIQLAHKKAEEAEERKRKKAEREGIKNFLDFKWSSCRTKYQLIRYNKESNRFETSLAVQIPYEKGREFYEKLKDGTLKVGDRLLYYTVLEVGKLVKVGCHTFEKSYLLDYGKKVFA